MTTATTTTTTTTLLLDPDIRDWVVLPLFLVLILAGLLRHSVGLWLQGPPVKLKPIPQRALNTLKQARQGSSYVAASFTTKVHLRRQYYAKLLNETADWCETQHEKNKENDQVDDDDSDDPMSMMMNNPLQMLKGNMAFMVQNMIMMQGIQHFFSGFILLQVPFPLTAGFKPMFQRGMETLVDLQPSYVSSVSWYFLVMYGLRSFFRIVIGEASLEIREQQQDILQQQGLQPAAAATKHADIDAMVKQLRQEAETIEMQSLQPFSSKLDSVEKRLLGSKRYPKKTLGHNDDLDFLLSSSKKTSSSSSSSKKKKTQ